jgi:hypothetical protein
MASDAISHKSVSGTWLGHSYQSRPPVFSRDEKGFTIDPASSIGLVVPFKVEETARTETVCDKSRCPVLRRKPKNLTPKPSVY